ncbi:hypothetical protein Saso_74960 [Streptomyces asoensis]|uniref:Uncharacterized protein n=1 Tax=Streptomyces asoensis TaxID=249586 RepID=A0ABQ3SCJ5_9ACTN|nr:hypothetical protein GCM10010496_64180 [Streptomyces asoensis]GHI65846.1 hypothetical protein Saso_74960 [Streptomyces asoensis]
MNSPTRQASASHGAGPTCSGLFRRSSRTFPPSLIPTLGSPTDPYGDRSEGASKALPDVLMG